MIADVELDVRSKRQNLAPEFVGNDVVCRDCAVSNRDNFKTAMRFYCGGLRLDPQSTRMEIAIALSSTVGWKSIVSIEDSVFCGVGVTQRRGGRNE